MAFDVEITDQALGHLKGIRKYNRRRIVDTIYQQLEHQPTVPTRHRKCLKGVVPDFHHVPPVWELRIGEHRVFYDVDETAQVVFVRAVLPKAHGQTTEDIIHERNDS